MTALQKALGAVEAELASLKEGTYVESKELDELTLDEKMFSSITSSRGTSSSTDWVVVKKTAIERVMDHLRRCYVSFTYRIIEIYAPLKYVKAFAARQHMQAAVIPWHVRAA